MPKRIDLTGRHFGELTVISFSHSHIQPSKQKRAIWNVLCSCGVEKKMSTSTLISGKTVSCGHVGLRNRINARKLPQGVAEANYLYSAYRKRAEYNGFDFLLTKDHFKELTQSNCHYCNSELSQMRKTRRTDDYVYKYNGIDRINSSLGYIPANVVPCCAICNMMKNDLPQEVFLNHVKRIAENADYSRI